MAAVKPQESTTERILLLDDDPEICELTQTYLQQQGLVVDTVQSGDALDRYLTEHDIDLLVLDLMLPGEHGLAILTSTLGWLPMAGRGRRGCWMVGREQSRKHGSVTRLPACTTSAKVLCGVTQSVNNYATAAYAMLV